MQQRTKEKLLRNQKQWEYKHTMKSIAEALGKVLRGLVVNVFDGDIVVS